MSEMLKKYEISVWDDERITEGEGDNQISYYKERKLAIIGGSDMVGKGKVYDPVLHLNVNGETTLTFSLQYRYFDELEGDFVTNPIQPLLINERKVKLFYDDEWYDFIIKECNESSEEDVFTYTAKDIFVNELSKQGYGIELNRELNNNLGTVIELGKIVVEDTDWEVDEENSDLLQQTVSEPLYEGTVSESFEALNLDTNETDTIAANEVVYLFYSNITNKDGKNLQFLRFADSTNWTYDDHNVITGTNYRVSNATINDTGNEVTIDGGGKITGLKIFTSNQAYRLVYQQRAVYDPVMEQYAEVYHVDLANETEEIYKTVTTDYSTSTLIKSFITGGTDFQVAEGKEIVGWDNLVLTDQDNLGSLSVSTYPTIDTSGTELTTLDKINALSSYLKVKLPAAHHDGSSTDKLHKNFIFNRGFMDNGGIIENISKGERYAFRIRAGVGADGAKPTNLDLTQYSGNSKLPIKVYVAFYTTKTKTIDGVSQSLKTFKSDDIIFNFSENFTEEPKIITGGELTNNDTVYVISNVPQTPSLKYYYQVGTGNEAKRYIWNPDKKKYESYSNQNWFLKYYMTTAQAKKNVTNKELTDPSVRIGLFIGTNNMSAIGASNYLYINDVEIFKYLLDADNNVILPGNIPTARAVDRISYYRKPKEGATKDTIITYSTLEDLESDLYLTPGSVQPSYNEDCEKILSIEESQSNCFNILQTLCETFECWLKLKVEHEQNGAIKLNENHKPIKKVLFKEYVGKDNSAGFRYGINLNSIERNIDSNEIVTRLIVAESQSDYTETGTLSIALADANPSKESIIYNLDYYVQNGLIDDREKYTEDLLDLYGKIKPLNVEIQQLSAEQSKAQLALTEVESQANVYIETQEAAQEKYNEALEDFKKISGTTYSKYKVDSAKGLEEGLLETVGTIYGAAAVLNTIGGITTATEQEFKNLQLKVEGAKEYEVTVSTYIPDNPQTQEAEEIHLPQTKLGIDDYVQGFSFKFQNSGDVREFESSLNKKEFEVESDNVYTQLIVDSVPEGYLFQYISLDDGKTYKVSKGTFKISDEDGNLIRRFRLVPTEKWIEEYPGYQKQIDEKVEQKKQYVKDFERKYRQYIQEGTWESDDYIDSNLYYFDALQVARTSAFPQVSYTINVAEVSELEGLEDYSFKIGDKTYIEDTEFFGWTVESVTPTGSRLFPKAENVVKTPVKEEVILSEIEWHLDDLSENVITVQNYKTQFEDLFQRINATVQQVQYNQVAYQRAANALNNNGLIDTSVLINSLAALVGNTLSLTPSSTVTVSEQGLVANDPNNAENFMKLVGNGLFASTDGGKSWSNLINADGITAKAITAGAIDTQNITIMDGDNTSFRWDKNGLSAYGGYENENGYDLSSFVRMDKYGIYGINNGTYYAYDDLNKIINDAHFSLTWDGFRIRNKYGNGYVSISSDNDFEVVRTEEVTGRDPGITIREIPKIKIGALEKDDEGTPTKYGINVYNDDGQPVFATDDYGNISITGELNATSGNFRGSIIVGDEASKYIVIEGTPDATDIMIASSDYIQNTSTGWVINGAGDAVFNNVSVRGAIKTAVFEYSEIEAVGGAFLFRPSSSIKNAEIVYSYGLTEDTIFDADKTYYTLEDEAYVAVDLLDSDFYELTADTTYVTGKTYYELSETEEYIVVPATEYVEVEVVGTENPHDRSWYENIPEYLEVTDAPEDTNPSENGWYELVDDDYILTIDTSIDSTKTYYESIPSDTYVVTEDTTIDEDKIYYAFVNNTLSNPSEEGWYEDKAINPSEEGWYEISDNTLLITVEQPLLFRVGEWVKLSNDISDGAGANDGGLVHIYQVNRIENGIIYFTTVREDLIENIEEATDDEGNIHYIITNLVGGALISFGYDDSDPNVYADGRHNYGIGINSSDNYINLPERSISLFESKIDPSATVKVSYLYKGILGTLPSQNILNDKYVNQDVYQYMANTQGIFTNNMYIGDKEQYIAYYADFEGGRHLDIVSNAYDFQILSDSGELINFINVNPDSGVRINADKLNLTQSLVIGNRDGAHISVTDDSINFWNVSEYSKIINIPTGANPKENEWYEINEYGDYVLTQDTAAVAEKDYYKYNSEDRTAYMSGSKLVIPYSVVLNEMQVGETEDKSAGLWAWRVTSDQRIRLVWLGETSDIDIDEGGDEPEIPSVSAAEGE